MTQWDRDEPWGIKMIGKVMTLIGAASTYVLTFSGVLWLCHNGLWFIAIPLACFSIIQQLMNARSKDEPDELDTAW